MRLPLLFSLLWAILSGLPPLAGQSRQYIQLVYENDYFTSSDRYYTQGIRLEYGRRGRGSLLLSGLLLRFGSDTAPQHALQLVQEGFTPTKLADASVRPHDRPYAGLLYAGQSSATLTPDRRWQLRTQLRLGLIGPCALAGEEQRYIHRQTGNIIPRGWHHQIGNDLIANYEVELDRALLRRPWLRLSAGGHAWLGSYRTRAGLQTSARLGLRPAAWMTATHPGGLAFYLFSDLRLSAIGYDATLQGGFFRSDNAHDFRGADLYRGLLSAQVGLAVEVGKLQLRFSHVHLSPEFRGGERHAWGSCQIRFGF